MRLLLRRMERRPMCRSMATRAWARPGTDGSKISVIDLASRKVVHTIDFGHGVRPHCAMYDRNSGHVVCDNRAGQVGEHHRSEIVEDRRQRAHRAGAVAHAGAFAGRVARVYGECGAGNGVGAGHEGAQDAGDYSSLEDTQRISISRDDSMVFTADQTKPQLAVIDTATNKVKTWVPLPAVGYGTAPTLDGRWLAGRDADGKASGCR